MDQWEQPGPDLAERMRRAVPPSLMRQLIEDSHRVADSQRMQPSMPPVRETPEQRAAQRREHWETNGGNGWHGFWNGHLTLEEWGRKDGGFTEPYDPEAWYTARHHDAVRRRQEYSRLRARGQL